MKGISTNPRILLCTPYRRFNGDYLDVVSMSVTKFPRARAPLRVSPGLRFIKQNVPEVEILEFPMWHEYAAKLGEGWDVVGFSFYQYQIGEVQKMIVEARRQGIKELWAGNYGALDYSIPDLVDRVFIGPAEDKIAQAFGSRISDEEIEHPVMVVNVSVLPGLRNFTLGMFYTAHGCPFNCNFCQSQAFEDRLFTVNFESVERVAEYYHKIGIKDVVVWDELFGIHPGFTDKLTRLFARYNFRWTAESRASIFTKNLDTWYERGLRAMGVGVESMIQERLDEVNKKQKVEEVLEFARRTQAKPGTYRIITYMIGYENMTSEQTWEDALLLKQVGFEINGATVITPYPRTPLWDELDSRYGIFEKDYRKYDSRHLVWKHPHISRVQMEYLLKTLKGMLNQPMDFYRRSIKKLIIGEMRKNGAKFLWHHLAKGPISSMRIDDRKQVFLKREEHPFSTHSQSEREREPKLMLERAAEAGEKGNSCFVVGDFNRALDCYRRCVQCYRSAGHKAGQASAVCNVGLVFHQVGRYKRALNCFKEALKLGVRAGDLAIQADILSNLGGVYYQLGDFMKAIKFAERARTLYLAMDSHNELKMCEQNIKLAREAKKKKTGVSAK